MPMPGDDWLDDGPSARVHMTRAVAIAAPPEVVWRWLAQVGRGAGWHSVDRLDNGGRASARHVVSWIPPPALGDATAIGYLRHLKRGRELAWWIPALTPPGATLRSVMAFRIRPAAAGTRLVERFSWDATGLSGRPFLYFFQVIDTFMAVRQLVNLKRRIERFDPSGGRGETTETGARDQFQLYHALYADGGHAGVVGRERATEWREAAIRDGVLPVC